MARSAKNSSGDDKDVPMDRILIVTDFVNAGRSTSVLPNLIQAFRQDGHEVQLVTLGGSEHQISSVESSSIVYPGRYCLRFLRKLRQQVKAVSADRVIAWGNLAIQQLGFCALGLPGHFCAVHESVDWWHHQSNINQLALRRYSQHLVHHQGAVARLQSLLGASGGAVACLPTTRMPPIETSNSESIKQRLGLPEDCKLIGSCASFEPRTRVKDFIWAGDLMSCIRQDVHWLAIGNGPQEWRLKKFASQLEIGEHLHFLDWDQGTPGVLAELDVYVQPSTWDDSCAGLITAMSLGLPVVGTSRMPHQELVTSGDNGFAVERGARNEIARCVNRLVNQPEIATRMGRRSQQRHGELATMEQLAGCLLYGMEPSQNSSVAA